MPKHRITKRKHRLHDKELREEIAVELENIGWSSDSALQLSQWDPYDQNASCPFFDTEWMYGIADGFDIVIGNPPYGIVFDLSVKANLEMAYPSFKRNNDIYVAFYERGLELITMSGHMTYISPNTFLNGEYFKGLRKHLTTFSELHEIYDFKNSPVFQDPTVFVCICRCSKPLKLIFPYSLSIREFVSDEQGEEVWSAGEHIIHSPDESSLKIGDPIFERMVNNKEFCTIDDMFYVKDVGFNYWTKGRGKRRGGGSIGQRVLYSGIKKNPNDIPFIKGRDIGQWQIASPSNYLRHDYENQLDPVVDTFRFTTRFLEQKPKVVYRQTSSRIIAAIDMEKRYLDKTVHLIVPKESWNFITPESLVGLLNSRLFDHFYHHLSQERSGRTFAQVKATYIKRLPIPRSADLGAVASITEQIVEAKTLNYEADTLGLETRLDEEIYGIYGLSKDEIHLMKNKAV